MNLTKKQIDDGYAESQRLVEIFTLELTNSKVTNLVGALAGLWAFGEILGRSSESIGMLDERLEAIRAAALRVMEVA